MDGSILDARSQILWPLVGLVVAIIFASLPEYICASWITLIIGAATSIISGTTIGAYVAGGRSGIVPGIFGAVFWGVTAPFLIWLPLGTVFLPLLALIFGRDALDAVFSVITICRINVIFSSIGIIAGSIIGGRIVRPRGPNSQ
jgi:hypothetical protein